MHAKTWLAAVALAVLVVAGCGKQDSPQASNKGDKPPPSQPAAKPADEAAIKASLEKLDKDDREAAELQRFCAVQNTSRLGSMGVPVKIKLKGKEGEEEVFLCCKGCSKEAEKDPAKTLAKVADLQIATTLDKLSPEDRKLAVAQRFCVIDDDGRLGSMGAPIKIMVKGEAVFVCCKGCEKTVLKDEDKAVARAKELRAKSATPPPK